MNALDRMTKYKVLKDCLSLFPKKVFLVEFKDSSPARRFVHVMAVMEGIKTDIMFTVSYDHPDLVNEGILLHVNKNTPVKVFQNRIETSIVIFYLEEVE